MRGKALALVLLCGELGLAGVIAGPKLSSNSVPMETRRRILALDPEHVTEADIGELLSQMPAPRIINIHGGLLPIKRTMNSFARFLIGMGYPEASIRDPVSGAFTYGYYDRSDKIAGTIAWYYERDGLRPMIVGHSLGGIQALRVLYKLAGDRETTIPVWNAQTRRAEKRDSIIDPLTGMTRPVVGVQVSYATAAVAGGLGRILPNEWDMNGKLRKVPDSVEEFTGFQKGFDILGGDYMGYGPANEYHSTGSASVRNVRLRAASSHSTIPDAKGLLKSQEVRDWIQSYQPGGQLKVAGNELSSKTKSARVVWAAEVWHGIKKHWVLEEQRLIRAGLARDHGD